jgi:hypothetical protein
MWRAPSIAKLWRTAQVLRRSLEVLSSPQSGVERFLVREMAVRTQELLAGQPFEVTSQLQWVVVTGTGRLRGHTTMLMQAYMLRLELPAEEGLTVLLESYARRLQEFLSTASGVAWPRPGVEPRVTIGPDVIEVAWHDATTGVEVCRLRPLIRGDLAELDVLYAS